MTKRRQSREVAIIGLGRFGSSLAHALVENGYSVLGIDRDRQRVQRIADEITFTAILDATNEDALRQVDITSFDTVVVAIGADFESNVLVTANLKNMGIPHVISKAVSERQREILLRLGADRVVEPEHDGGRRLAEEITMPAMLERVRLGPHHGVAEVIVPDSMAGQSLARLDLRKTSGITVLLIERGEELIVSPPPDTVLTTGDLLLILGSNEDLLAFSNR